MVIERHQPELVLKTTSKTTTAFKTDFQEANVVHSYVVQKYLSNSVPRNAHAIS